MPQLQPHSSSPAKNINSPNALPQQGETALAQSETSLTNRNAAALSLIPPLSPDAQERLDKYVEACKQNKIRLTAMRKRVLVEIILHAPVKAYSIISNLEKSSAIPTSPPLVYRALHFLEEKNLIHKLERLRAYVTCQHAFSSCAQCALFHCTNCHHTIEVCGEQYLQFLNESETKSGFHVTGGSLELYGLCKSCSAKGSKTKTSPQTMTHTQKPAYSLGHDGQHNHDA